MSVCREGFDLLKRPGRANFWRYLKRGRFQRYMWVDTLGRVLCWLVGEHAIRQSFDNEITETSCTRCSQWLRQDGYKWVGR